MGVGAFLFYKLCYHLLMLQSIFYLAVMPINILLLLLLLNHRRS